MADDIIRETGLTADEIIAANLAKLGVGKAPVAMDVMRERVFKKAVELANRDGKLASSKLIAAELGINQALAHRHLQTLNEDGRMVKMGSGPNTRYMPVVR